MAANAGYRTPRYLTFKQALDLGGHVRKGEHGTKVYFVKQLQVSDPDGEEDKRRVVPMMREYTVFNVDQCEGLPNRVLTLGEVKVRNIDERYPRRIIVASRCPQQFRLAAVLFLTQWSKVMYQTMEGKSLKIERNPLSQLEINERQVLQGILRLQAELRPQLSGSPGQAGSSGR